mgnify:FL=1
MQVLLASIVTDPSGQSASPDHPAKLEPESGVTVKATTVPLL